MGKKPDEKGHLSLVIHFHAGMEILFWKLPENLSDVHKVTSLTSDEKF